MVSSAWKQWSPPGMGISSSPRLVARILTLCRWRTPSSPMVLPTQDGGTAVS